MARKHLLDDVAPYPSSPTPPAETEIPMSDRKSLLSGLVWEEPPVPRAGRGGTGPRHTAVADSLKEHPGEWARIAQFDRQGSAAAMAAMIKRGGDAFGPRASFEATSRTIRPGHVGSQVVYVYARYVGRPDTP